MLYEFDHQQLDTLTAVATAPDGNANDEQLMARVQQQDEEALALLMGRHKPLLRTIISRVVHCDAETDDVFQDVFIEIWNRAAHYDVTKGKALGWIVTLARRRAIDRVRRRQAYDRAEERLRLQTEHCPPQEQSNTVEDDANQADCAGMLKEVLATLPEAQREALQLAYYRGLSQREIAKETGIPLGTIKTRLELAVRKVRAAVLAMGGAAEWSPTTA